MWGFQPQFRISLEVAAEQALEAIGAPELGPEALLIGFRVEGRGLPICVEPETGLVQPEHLGGVVDEGVTRYSASDDANKFHSDAGVHELRHAWYRDRHRADALADALCQAPGGSGRQFFVGPSARLGDYEIHAVLSVDGARFAMLPRLRTAWHTQMPMTVSLVEGAATRLLRRAALAMSLAKPPVGLSDVDEAPNRAAVQGAARHFVYSVATMTGNFLAHGLYDALERVATTPYEGRAGAGALLLAADDHPQLEVVLRFPDPVRVSSGRQLRKLLEMTAPDLDLLCTGDDVFGLGRLGPDYAADAESAFRFLIVGRGVWELQHAGTALMRVEQGQPALPRPRISENRFSDTITRVFPDLLDADVRALWELAQQACISTHGTMLVVSAAAEAERNRLAPQVIAIAPQRLSVDLLRSLTGIDGAILLAPDGTCHAVGVILDGYAAGTGDPGRGARYNSAVRYLQTTEAPCVIVIVSEDGMIDVHPELAPQVRREDVESAVMEFEQAASADPINFEHAYKRRREVERLSFYLSAAQAERANASTAQVEDARWDTSRMRIHLADFRADERMTDEYFLAP